MTSDVVNGGAMQLRKKHKTDYVPSEDSLPIVHKQCNELTSISGKDIKPETCNRYLSGVTGI